MINFKTSEELKSLNKRELESYRSDLIVKNNLSKMSPEEAHQFKDYLITLYVLIHAK